MSTLGMNAPKNDCNSSGGNVLPENEERTSRDVQPSEASQPSQAMTLVEPLPELHTPHRRRRIILWVGVALATLDLCVLPITYYYAFKFGTNLSVQDSMSIPKQPKQSLIVQVFAIITGVYGLLSFTHYFLRSLKLFRSKTSSKWRPVGWTKWGMVGFL